MDTKITEGKIQVSKTIFEKTTEVEKIIVNEFKTDPAHIGVNLQRTINLQSYGFPYESMKVGVLVTMPCYVEETIDMYKKISEFGSKLLEREVKKAINYVNRLAEEAIANNS